VNVNQRVAGGANHRFDLPQRLAADHPNGGAESGRSSLEGNEKTSFMRSL
jgi:hypothetical protein